MWNGFAMIWGPGVSVGVMATPMTEPIVACKIESEKMCLMADAAISISNILKPLSKDTLQLNLLGLRKERWHLLRLNRYWHNQWLWPHPHQTTRQIFHQCLWKRWNCKSRAFSENGGRKTCTNVLQNKIGQYGKRTNRMYTLLSHLAKAIEKTSHNVMCHPLKIN